MKAEQLEALRFIEQRSGTSMGALVRLAVDEWLKKSVTTERARRRPVKAERKRPASRRRS